MTMDPAIVPKSDAPSAKAKLASRTPKRVSEICFLIAYLPNES